MATASTLAAWPALPPPAICAIEEEARMKREREAWDNEGGQQLRVAANEPAPRARKTLGISLGGDRNERAVGDTSSNSRN